MVTDRRKHERDYCMCAWHTCESIIKELIISPVMDTGWGLIPANRPRDNYAPCMQHEITSPSLAAQMGIHKRCYAPTG